MSDPQPTILATEGIAKSYGPVVALRSVDLAVAPGEIHALLGANGAGKSTFVKILSGVIGRDAGTTAIDPELPELNLVMGEAAEWEPGPALSNSFGFGGHNGTIVLGPA